MEKSDLRNLPQFFLAIGFCQQAPKIRYLHKNLTMGVRGFSSLTLKIVWKLFLKLWGRKTQQGAKKYFKKPFETGAWCILLTPKQMSVSSRLSHVVLSYILATHVVTSCLLRAAKNTCRNRWKPGFSHSSQKVKGGKCQSCLSAGPELWLNFQTVGSVCLCSTRDSSAGHSPPHSSVFCSIKVHWCVVSSFCQGWD